MKQRFVYLKRYYISDLMDDVQDKIMEMNEDKCYLTDFKFSGLEGNSDDSYAYLLFEERN